MGPKSRFWCNLAWFARRNASRGFNFAGFSRLALRVFPCGETYELPDASNLWRRFMASDNHLIWDDNLGEWRPTPASLIFDPDLSCSWGQHLEMHGKGPGAVLESDARYTLVGEFIVSRIRSLGFLASHTPHQNSLIGCAHVSVDWPPSAIPPGKTQPNKDVRNDLRRDLTQDFSWINGNFPARPEGA